MRYFYCCVTLLVLATLSAAQEPETDQLDIEETTTKTLFDAFTVMMKKTAMVGHFTVDGDEKKDRTPERYEISRVMKQERGDDWSIFARIKYGDHDVTLPVPVQIKWAGRTPVITVDNVTLPGMGTFDARVLIWDNKYTGTWKHGQVGGLMFGHIEKQDTESPDKVNEAKKE